MIGLQLKTETIFSHNFTSHRLSSPPINIFGIKTSIDRQKDVSFGVPFADVVQFWTECVHERCSMPHVRGFHFWRLDDKAIFERSDRAAALLRVCVCAADERQHYRTR